MKGNNIFGDISFDKLNKMKQMIFSMILFTDMAFHNQLVQDFGEIDFSESSKGALSDNDLKV